jgi:hypothetical protein
MLYAVLHISLGVMLICGRYKFTTAILHKPITVAARSMAYNNAQGRKLTFLENVSCLCVRSDFIR